MAQRVSFALTMRRVRADNPRAAGASEAEITEAIEVGYLYGGTASLVMGANAFHGG